MKSILQQLKGHVTAALEAAFGEDGRDVDPIIRAAADPKFGDYQSNVAMGFAKRLGKKPRDVAQAICDALTASKEDGGKNATEPFGAMCESPDCRPRFHQPNAQGRLRGPRVGDSSARPER